MVGQSEEAAPANAQPLSIETSLPASNPLFQTVVQYLNPLPSSAKIIHIILSLYTHVDICIFVLYHECVIYIIAQQSQLWRLFNHNHTTTVICRQAQLIVPLNDSVPWR